MKGVTENMKVPSGIKEILGHLSNQFRVIEVAIIAALLWWAFILIVPVNTFASSDVYNTMANVAREEVWGIFFLAVALLNLYSMIMDKFALNVIALVISSGIWAYIATAFAISDIATTGTGVYYILACLNTFVVYKVGELHGR